MTTTPAPDTPHVEPLPEPSLSDSALVFVRNAETWGRCDENWRARVVVGSFQHAFEAMGDFEAARICEHIGEAIKELRR